MWSNEILRCRISVCCVFIGKVQCRSAGDVLPVGCGHRGDKAWICLGCCGCCRHWLNANLNCVLLHRKDQEQFEIACGQLSLSCFMFPFLHWLLISALLLTSMWLQGYRNLRTCVICLICKMQLIYLRQQCVELLITPGDSNYLTD